MSRAEPIAVSRERLLYRLATTAAPRGLRIARDLLGSREEAEDAVQEALARACEACERLREPDAVDGWFYRILTNVCMRTLRRRRLKQVLFGRGDREPDMDMAEARPDEAPRADRALAHTQDVHALMRALDRLPAMQRTALLLRYGHDLSIAEIASMLDVGPATAKTHLIRGLRRLRRSMERQS